MKSATIPSVRVATELRAQIEQVLGEDESLSSFVETAVRNTVRQRMEQADFVARGMRSLAKARKSGQYIEADEVLEGLAAQLAEARSRLAQAAR
ncbi:YlcI/YnfO family protein [Variovorax robiniae]|uniref:YlcI/YnfO family protein n=1 Tax=Variovorax robiniae TaxID=1836199 RepID=A0ABU8X6S3_9BURK